MAKEVLYSIVFLVLITFAASTNVVRFLMQEMEEKFVDKMNQEGKAETYERIFGLTSLFHKNKSSLRRLRGFQWRNCAQPSKELFVVETFSVTPDPLILPGSLTVNFNGNFNKTLDAPLEVDVTMQKKVLGMWITVPCIDGVGSCKYSDICDTLRYAVCPTAFQQQGVPCKCPFNQGEYKLSDAAIDVEISPSSVVDGDYHIISNLSMDGTFVACYEVYVTIESA